MEPSNPTEPSTAADGAAEPTGEEKKPEQGASSEDAARRGGRCAIAGRPNVGKSTLLNRLLKHHFVAATSKPGTTRTATLGVYADDETQIAFVDTPGLAKPRTALHKVLVEQAQEGITSADVVLFLTQAPADRARRGSERIEPKLGLHPADLVALNQLQTDAPVILVVNKVDRLADKTLLLPFIESLKAVREFAAIVPISAKKDKSFEGLIAEIREHLTPEFLYDEEFLTDKPARFFAAEFVREAIMRRTHKEVPYGCAVTIDTFEEDGEDLRIAATIVVEKDSHKGIVIGARGSRIKEVGIEAREALCEFLQKRVHVKLWVRVQEGWTSDPRHVRTLATSEVKP